MAKFETILIFPARDQIAELSEILGDQLPKGAEYAIMQDGQEVFVSVNAPKIEGLGEALSAGGVEYRMEVPQAPAIPGMSESAVKLAKVLHKAGGRFREAVVSRKGGLQFLRDLKGGPRKGGARRGRREDRPWYFGPENRHNCWEAAQVVTSGWGEGTVSDVGEIDRASFGQATAAAYADAVSQAAAAMPADPSTVPGLPDCEEPCVLIFQIQFAAIETSDSTLVSLEGGGQAAIQVESEGGASAGLEAKISFNVDVNEVKAEIQWVLLAMCVGEGAPETEEPEDDFLTGEEDPLSTGETADVYGGEVPIRCPQMSTEGMEEATSGSYQTTQWENAAETLVGPRTPREAMARRNALDAAAEAASDQLAHFRSERRCGPPCTAESIEISIGPVASAMRLVGGQYNAYVVEYYAECPWYVARACERG